MKKFVLLLLVLAMLPACALGEGQLTVVHEESLADFATAVSGDPATIPYPANRDENGYLTEGEFLHEDAENGLWAYLSPTLQVEIVRFTQADAGQRWFVADVRFNPEKEQLGQYIDIQSSMKNHMHYGATIAQMNKLVVAINSDFYYYRVDRKQVVGNVIRNGKVLYNLNRERGDSFPNLDTMALHNDGRMTVYSANDVTADELLAQGDVHDALSFGPWLIKDGEVRDYKGKNYNKIAPRSAIGMVEPGHYILLVVEAGLDGKKTGDGITAKGFTLPQVANMLYAYGCEQAFNMDGGNTSQLVFMGEKLNRTGNMDTGKTASPRTVNELFGLGTSDLCHTDWLNGKPKK